MTSWKQWSKNRGFHYSKSFYTPNRKKTNARYYQLHKAELKEKRKKHRDANRKKINARRRTLYHRNKNKG